MEDKFFNEKTVHVLRISFKYVVKIKDLFSEKPSQDTANRGTTEGPNTPEKIAPADMYIEFHYQM